MKKLILKKQARRHVTASKVKLRLIKGPKAAGLFAARDIEPERARRRRRSQRRQCPNLADP